jgi:ABC-type nitrate/sulfonate/bicarbonate transport system substrate-binding protein
VAQSWGRLLALLLAVICCLGTWLPAACGAELKRVRIAYVPVINWLPAWIAKEKGIFEQNGLDVSLTPTQNISVLPGTLGRQFDIAASTPPDLIKAALSGLDIMAVAGETIEAKNNPTSHVIVRQNSGITRMADLKGKVIAAPSLGAILHASVLHCLKKSGVDTAAVRGVEVPFPNMPDQLKAGNVDAVEELEPFAGQMLAAGNVSIGDPLLCAGDEVLYTFWIAQSEWARANRATVEAFITSLQQSKTWSEQNPKEARAVLAKYTKLPDPVVEKIPMPTYRFALHAPDFAVWAGILRDLGQVSQPLDEARLVMGTP